jgi:hypothetical protein
MPEGGERGKMANMTAVRVMAIPHSAVELMSRLTEIYIVVFWVLW